MFCTELDGVSDPRPLLSDTECDLVSLFCSWKRRPRFNMI